MSQRWLHLRLDAPLMAFGGVAVDYVGPTRLFPAISALTGLLANALGWHWSDREAHQMLQERLVWGAALARSGVVLTDIQNAKLEKNDKGWTRSGEPEGRSGATYSNPHRRRREYLADHDCRVVLRLLDSTEGPELAELEQALNHPARPLFIGRKPCLPSSPLLAGEAIGVSAHAALKALDVVWADGQALWPDLSDVPKGARIVEWPDQRNWKSGLHGGARRVVLGSVDS